MNDRKLTRLHLGIGALVAAVALGLAIPLLRTQMGPEPDARPAPTVAPDIGRIVTPFVYDIDFADQNHGFALWGRCTDGRDYRCERRLLVMEDGENWTSREFGSPELAAPARLTGRVVALGATRLMLTDLNEGGANDRFFSEDSGRMWRVVPSAPSEEVVQLGPESVLESVCVEAGADPATCARRRLAVTHPHTGQPAWLAGPPALEAPTPEPRRMPDGGWWVSGRDPATGRWAVAASHDNGRGWTTAAVPLASDIVSRLWIAGSAAEVYVLATGSVPGAMEPQTLIAIFLSTDRGRSWTQTWSARRDSPRTVGGALVTPDGALFVAPNDVGPGYRSTDGGRGFTAVLDGPRLTSIRRTRAGYLARASDRPSRDYLTSADGLAWREITLP